jgi:large subunit ribosomal protein L10
VKKEDKEQIVSTLTERLRASDTLLVADYRGLTMPQIDELRGRLLASGATFTVVKNTLTRRAAEAAGADALLTLLEGPSAIAFVESEGDPVAVAKALNDAARTTRVLTIRGGVLEGRAISADEVESLGKLPPVDVLRGQVLGAITAPLTTIVALFTAPLQDLVGLIDARIEQLGEPAPAEAAGATADTEAPASESLAEAQGEPEADAGAAAETATDAQAEPAAEAEGVETATDAEAEPAAEAGEGAETATDAKAEPEREEE